MKTMCRLATCFFLLVGLIALTAANVQAGGSDPNAKAVLGVSYQWPSNMGRSSSVSPEIHLTGVPDGTVKYKCEFQDEDRPQNDHGGGTVECGADKNVVQKGALKRYRGPDPPPSENHTYTVTVKALDANGKVLATGKGSNKCCR